MSPPRLYVAEPHPSYMHRPMLVVDASVIASLVFVEANADEAASWVRGRTLCAPHLLDAEIANSGLNKIRRKLQTLPEIEKALDGYRTLEIDRFPMETDPVVAIGARYGLSAYDAAYLWLAERLGAPLATFDARLGEAARKHLGGEKGAG